MKLFFQNSLLILAAFCSFLKCNGKFYIILYDELKASLAERYSFLCSVSLYIYIYIFFFVFNMGNNIGMITEMQTKKRKKLIDLFYVQLYQDS
jgi:hypothetical protein